MKLWVHRIRGEDGQYRYIPNAEFERGYKGGLYDRRMKGDWVPVKVELSDNWKPEENGEGIVTIVCPESDELRVKLAEVLAADREGRPILRFVQSDDRAMEFALQEIIY